MSKVKHSNLKVVDQQHQEPVRREDELESCKLTPAEITDRTREIRSILENFLDGLAGVPFDVVGHYLHDHRRLAFLRDEQTATIAGNKLVIFNRKGHEIF